MRSKLKISGHHLTEIVLLLAATSASFLMLRLYGMRTFQARFKQGPDYVMSKIKEEGVRRNKPRLANMNQTQYDPYYSEAATQDSRSGGTTVGFPYSTVNQTTTRSGKQTVNVPGAGD